MENLINKLSRIGDAIRSKTNSQRYFTLDEMVDEISSISGGGISEEDLPTLFTPSITLKVATGELTITDDKNSDFVSGYEIYANDVLCATIKSKQVVLSDYIEQSETLYIKVKAIGDKFNKSNFSNTETWIYYSEDSDSGLIYEISSDGTYALCTGVENATTTDFEIAAYYKGLPVTTLKRQGAFYHNDYVTSIRFPDTMTTLETYSIESCPKLTDIYIGGNTSLSDNRGYNYALSNSNLKNLHIVGDLKAYCENPNVTKVRGWTENNITNIYLGDELITDLTIPDGTSTIVSQAFRGGTNITSVTMPNSMESIGNSSFRGCSNISVASLQNSSIKSIGEYAFHNCSKLYSILLPNVLETIDRYAFGYAKPQSLVIPNSVTYIGSDVLYQCSTITELTLPFTGSSRDSTLPLGHIFGTAYSGSTSQSYYPDKDSTSMISNKFLIPSSLKKVVITDGELFGGEFSSCGYLTEVILPESVTKIGDKGFYYCKQLEEIKIPKSVKSIGVDAFYECSALKKVHIDDITSWCNIILPESNVDRSNPLCVATQGLYLNGQPLQGDITLDQSIEKISPYAFKGCEGITSISIPNSVVDIGKYAFSKCKSISNIVVPNSVNRIGEYAFYECLNIQEVTLPFVGVDRYPTTTFYPLGSVFGGNIPSSMNHISQTFITGENGETSMRSYYLPTTLKKVTITNCDSIYGGAFMDCSQLSEINIPQNVTYIGDRAFYSCSGLTSPLLTSPTKIQTIGESAFYNCYIVGELDLSKCTQLKNLPNWSFYNCSKLTKVVLPSSIETIASNVFQNCSSLEEITIPFIGTSRDAIGSNGVFGAIFGRYSSTMSSGSNGALQSSGKTHQYDGVSSNGYKEYITYLIPTSLKKVTILECEQINENAFQNCDLIEEINFPSNSMQMGNNAFKYCKALKQLSLNLQNISNYAFYYCSSLQQVSFSGAQGKIGDYSFYYCSSLSSIDLSNCSFYGVGSNSFYHCEAQSIKLPQTVQELETQCFSYNSKLTNINIPNGITTIPKYAFQGCSNLSNLELPNSITTIEDNAFANDSNLTFSHISNSLYKIGNNAFSSSIATSTYGNCKYIGDDESPYKILYKNASTSYEQYLIHEDTICLNNSCFSSCTKMLTVEIPNKVLGIGESAFAYTNIENIVVPNNVMYIGSNTFNSPNLLSVTIGSGVIEIGDGKIIGGSSTKIENIYVDENNQNFKDVDGNLYSKDGSIFIKYAIGKKQDELSLPQDVLTIGSNAFSSCQNLKSIIIPESVQSIGEEAFSLSKNLTSVVMSDSITSIGKKAFQNCKTLQSVRMSNNVVDFPESLFDDCSSLTSLNIPTNLQSVGTYAFEYCGLTTIELPNGIKTIGSSAFSYSKVENITLPDSITSIEGNAFQFSNVKSIRWPRGTTSIGNSMFYSCRNLSYVYIPNTVTSLSTYNKPFNGCCNIQQFEVEDGNSYYKSINGSLYSFNGQYLYYYAMGLTNPTYQIEDGTKYIDEFSFNGCTNIQKLIVPPSVVAFYNRCLLGCTNLTRIDMSNHTTRPSLSNSSSIENNDDLQIKVPEDMIDAWKSATNWSTFADKLVTEFSDE